MAALLERAMRRAGGLGGGRTCRNILCKLTQRSIWVVSTIPAGPATSRSSGNPAGAVGEQCFLVVAQVPAAPPRRSVGATAMNEQSSRSHMVFILAIEGSNEGTGQKVKGAQLHGCACLAAWHMSRPV